VPRDGALEAAGPITAANWQDPPFNAWGLTHTAELVPTAVVSRHVRSEGPVRVVSPESGLVASIVPDAFLEATHTEAFVVMQGDDVVDERYLGASRPADLHLLMSVSKSLCALVVGQLVGRGLIDPGAVVAAYVPELAGGAYGTATVQQVLDMTASVEYSEEYHNADAHVHQQDRVAGWRPRRAGDPADTYEFLTTLRQAGEHGRVFQYCSASTDVLAWVVENVTGRRYAEMLSSGLWSRLGCSEDASITVDDGGFAFANGGVSCTARDLARVGRLVLNGGCVDGRQVVPRDWIDQILAGGVQAAAAGTVFQSIHPCGSYRNQWWSTGDDRGTVYATGIHGQYLWLDPVSDVVVVKFSSLPRAVTEETSRSHAEAFGRLTRALG
jgi:CubicO group peptidase (beta-lactamase class C family)